MGVLRPGDSLRPSGPASPRGTAGIDRWEHLLTGLEKDPLSLDREVDWVIKYRLLEEYRERRGIPEKDARLGLVDLSYHDVDRTRGLYYVLERHGLVDKTVTDEQVSRAQTRPLKPPGRRLRGRS